jgi:preprotein translocase subunit YajC
MFLSKIFTALSILLDSAVDNVDSYLNGTAANATDAAASAATQPTANIWTTLLSFIPFVLVIVAFYFFLIRPQRKQEKETQKMRNSIEIGDQITTIGGITGIVRQIKDDDTYIIETGADKNRISIKKWAIQSKDTISDS